METPLSRSVLPANKIKSWLKRENVLITTFMEGVIVTNAKMLSVAHGVAAGYWLLRSLSVGYPAVGMCLLWFIISLLLCLKQKYSRMEQGELDKFIKFVREKISELDAQISALDGGNWNRNVRGDYDKAMLYSGLERARSDFWSLLKRDYECEK